jgi:hypothetical protein
MLHVFSLLLLVSTSFAQESFECDYDPLVRLGKCLDASDEFLGKAVPDKDGKIDNDPWMAKKIVNDVKCNNLGKMIKADKGREVECSYIKEDHAHKCVLKKTKEELEEEED